ncbi:hypothetical protein [Aeromicrobium alkaliterrae]|uniref:DUF732 domain-containing protein n=1 Tax=Aeromicrobium alkaliterrae TaxID=302168 RepID=A0ABP4WEJ5_9ACTN
MDTHVHGRGRASRTLRASGGVAAAVLALVSSVTACGSNEGGETRCEDFALMSTDERADVVEQLLTEQGGTPPTEGTITLTVTAASYHCLSPDAADTLVKSVLG